VYCYNVYSTFQAARPPTYHIVMPQTITVAEFQTLSNVQHVTTRTTPRNMAEDVKVSELIFVKWVYISLVNDLPILYLFLKEVIRLSNTNKPIKIETSSHMTKTIKIFYLIIYINVKQNDVEFFGDFYFH